MQPPACVGTVEVWHADEGWGVLLTPDGLTVFCHFSQLDMAGYRSLVPGTAVYFDYERPGQDGCDARVRTAARVAVASGENAALRPPAHETADDSSYGSGLMIVWDEEPES